MFAYSYVNYNFENQYRIAALILSLPHMKSISSSMNKGKFTTILQHMALNNEWPAIEWPRTTSAWQNLHNSQGHHGWTPFSDEKLAAYPTGIGEERAFTDERAIPSNSNSKIKDRWLWVACRSWFHRRKTRRNHAAHQCLEDVHFGQQ